MSDRFGADGPRDPLRDIYGRRRRGRKRGRWIVLLLLLCILGAGGYFLYRPPGSSGPAPLIKAQGQPYKVKPQEPGGSEPPPEDKQVYSDVQSQGQAATPGVETLAPPAETPLPHPTADQPATTGQAATTGGAAPTQSPAAAAGQAGAPAAAPGQVPAASTGTAAPSSAAPAPQATATTTAPAASAAAAPAAKPQTQRQANLSAPAEPKLGPGQEWRIQLGALRSPNEAAHEWQRLQSRHYELLGSLTASIRQVDIAGKGVYYRIQAGPLADGTAATALCVKLKAAGMGCLPVKP
jgi:cell division septation protein DedD